MKGESHIRDVWYDNFLEELTTISTLVDQFNYISMDTEYPGTVFLPSEVSHDFEYQMVKVNTDNLRVIQVGITLSDSQGNLPRGISTWQFNLYFDLS